MKKILIISYFFPPCNQTASSRIYSWAKYLHLFGYYPIIVTRNWDVIGANAIEMSLPSGTETIHEKHEHYEVYYLPYLPSYRDRLYVKYGEDKLKFPRKILSFIELSSQLFTNKFIRYVNLYTFAHDYLKKNKDIKLVLISGNPFTLFKFGYLLNKKLGIKWVADYRDDWTTSQWSRKYSIIEPLLFKIDQLSEKKWLKTASRFTSISKFYVDQIAKLIHIKGSPVFNGFNDEDFPPIENHDTFEDFTITYNGTLYSTQPIEIFLEAFKIIVNEFRGKINITLYFPGLEYNVDQVERIKNNLGSYIANTVITKRIKKEEAIKILHKSHVLLAIAHEGIKGVLASKIFEYINSNKPIILCPSDNEVMEELLTKSNLGYIANDKNELVLLLRDFVNDFIKNKSLKVAPNKEEIMNYNRKNQTKNLATALDQVLND